jgi:hypothetical protein
MESHVNSSLQPGLQSASGGGFSIPLWVYLVVILVGVALAILFFLLSASAKRRASLPPMPGTAPAGNGSGFLIAGIASAILLVLAPLVVMLIMKPWAADSIVGRWSLDARCTGEVIEFTSDGIATADGRSKPYRLEGDQLTVGELTQPIQHNGDQLTIEGRTLSRCP